MGTGKTRKAKQSSSDTSVLGEKKGQRQKNKNKTRVSRRGGGEKVNKKDDTGERLCQLDRSTKQEDTGIARQCLINF
jgi:hypothetical protein